MTDLSSLVCARRHPNYVPGTDALMAISRPSVGFVFVGWLSWRLRLLIWGNNVSR